MELQTDRLVDSCNKLASAELMAEVMHRQVHMAQKVGDFEGAILVEGPASGYLAAPILRRRVGSSSTARTIGMQKSP